MKKGIIIVFGKNDISINNTLNFTSLFNQKIKICLINNGNHDKVLRFLKELQESSKCDISILNLRKEKTAKVAVKAGVRFLSNKENINLIVYAKPNNVCNTKLMTEALKEFDRNLGVKKDERVLLRSVYSINELFNYNS